jgi:hypothetical protein
MLGVMGVAELRKLAHGEDDGDDDGEEEEEEED